MSRIVAFKADSEEAAEIEGYMKAKHLRSLPELARQAFFAYMRQNKPGGHRTEKGMENETGSNGKRAGGIRPVLALTQRPESADT